MNDIRQSREYAKYLSSIGWKVKHINNNYYFLKKIFFITTIKLQRPEKFRYGDIKILSKNFRGLTNFIIEPKDKLNLKGFKVIKPFLPSKTLVLNLTKTEEEIYKNFSKDTKYALRKAESGIKVCEELEVFHKAWKSSVPFSRYVIPLDNLKSLRKSFGKNVLFLLSENKNSGAIFLVGNKTGYYWQAFTNSEGRKSLVQYAIVWEGIKWCKKRGAKYFDFEGIYDERFPLKNWKGFSAFKKKFGGEEKEFPGAYQKWFINL